jgi:hypothetical protein
MRSDAQKAWNNFVTLNKASNHEYGTERWAAAVANLYLGQANNGGLNSFLTYSYEISSDDVLLALTSIGARTAAGQLAEVLDSLGTGLPTSSQDERWDTMMKLWTKDADIVDVLSDDAETDLMTALESHVERDARYYLELQSPGGRSTP